MSDDVAAICIIVRRRNRAVGDNVPTVGVIIRRRNWPVREQSKAAAIRHSADGQRENNYRANCREEYYRTTKFSHHLAPF